MKEEYKVIQAYPNYEVSTNGYIRNQKGHTMKWIDNGKGYKTVKLYNDTKPQGRLCLVHRLVLSTFSPEGSGLEVNHIDGNKSNNTLTNLEWATRSHNIRHAHLNGLRSNKLSLDQVREIKTLSGTHEELAKLYNVKPTIISKIRRGHLYSYI